MIFKYLFIFLFTTLTLFSAEQKLESISLQLKWKNQFQFAGYYIAKEKGFYKDVGLDVDIKEYQNGVDIVQDVIDEKANYGVGYPSIVLEKALGRKIVLLSAIYQDSPHVLISLNPKIRSIRDFKNKTIMINTSALQTVSFISMLRANNLDFSDLNVIEPNYDINSLVRGEADLRTAYISNEPFILEEQGIEYTIWNPKAYGFDFYDDILFTSQGELKNHSQRVKKFNEASLKGFKYAFNHIDETVAIILKKYNTQDKGLKNLKYEATVLKKLAYSGVNNLGEINKVKIQRIIDIYNLFGLLETTINIDDFIYKAPSEFCLNREEKKYLKEKKVIKICINPNWMPYEKLQDGKHIGISADYFKIIAKTLDTKIEVFQTKNWNQSLEAMKNGNCDILSLTHKTKKRKKYMNFTDTFLQTPLVLATRLDAPFTDNLNALKDKKIGIPKSYIAGEYLKKRYPYLNFIEVDTLSNGLKKVRKGELYGYIGTLITIGYKLQKSFIGDLKIAAKFDENWDLSMGVRSDDPVLFSIMQKSINVIDEKEQQKILNSWLSVKYEKGTDYKLLLELVVIFLIVVFVLVFFYMREKKLSLKIQAQKESMELNHALLETLFDTIPSPVFYKDMNGVYQDCNTAFSEGILNKTKEEIIGKKMEDFKDYIPSHLLDIHIKKDEELYVKSGTQHYEMQIEDDKGNYRDFNFYKATLLSESKKVLGIIGIMLDITDLKNKEKELEKLASVDPLSKLYNRRYFTNTAEDILRIAKREEKTSSLIMLDIDNFKKINDTYGHKVGDDVIVAVSETLLSSSRDSDIVCRFGGEEFILLLPKTELHGSEVMAEKIRAKIENLSVVIENEIAISFTVSLGATEIILDDTQSLESAIKRADDALYEAKETGKNKVCTA